MSFFTAGRALIRRTKATTREISGLKDTAENIRETVNEGKAMDTLNAAWKALDDAMAKLEEAVEILDNSGVWK